MNEAHVLRPVSLPRIMEGGFTEEQRQRIFDVLRREGPWTMILAQEFTSPEQVRYSHPAGPSPLLVMESPSTFATSRTRPELFSTSTNPTVLDEVS